MAELSNILNYILVRAAYNDSFLRCVEMYLIMKGRDLMGRYEDMPVTILGLAMELCSKITIELVNPAEFARAFVDNQWRRPDRFELTAEDITTLETLHAALKLKEVDRSHA